MGIFDVFEDIITAPIMLPLKAANAAIALPGQAIKAAASTTLGAANAASKVASSGISASVRSIETISTTPFKTAQASVASVAGAAQNIGESLATPAMIAGAAVLVILLLRER